MRKPFQLCLGFFPLHLEGFPLSLRGHDLNRRADRFRSAISVEILCCGIPENDPAVEIGTDDAYVVASPGATRLSDHPIGG